MAALTIALALCCAPASASAQALLQGARIRVTHVQGQQVGSLVSATGDTLRFITTRGVDLAIPARDVALVEESAGLHRNFRKHFAVTAGGFLAVGAVIGAATYSPCEGTGFMSCFMAPESRSDAAVFGAAVGALVGLPIGLIAGAAVKTERWSPVEGFGQSAARVSLRPAVGRGRIGMTVSYAVEGGSSH